MKKLCSLCLAGILVLSISVLPISCGGGSGASTSRGGGTDATLTASKGGAAGDTVVQVAKLVAPVSTIGELKTASISSSKTYSLMRILDSVMSLSAKELNSRHLTSLYTVTEYCDSGNITIDVTDVNVLKKLVVADISANTCKIGSDVLNGQMEVDYVFGSLDALTNPTYDNLKNFDSITITTLLFTLTSTASSDNVTLTDLTMIFNGFSFNGNDLTGGTIAIGGSISGVVDNISINVGFDSYMTTFASDSNGVTIYASGRVSADCLGGWVNITTATDKPFFIPANAKCPQSGEISVTSGSDSVVVVITNYTITVYFNGGQITTYNSCEDVKGYCSG